MSLRCKIGPAALTVTLSLIGVMPSVQAAQAAERVCDASESKITRSPDGRWTASVQEQVCSSERGAVAGITVILARPDAPQVSGRVVTTAVPRSRDEWPLVVWRGPESLEVWVPNLANVVETKPGFEGVAVALKYCNDNPADRERVAGYQDALKSWMKETTAWAARRKQDPQQAGPRPVRPEEPRVPSGRCDPASL
jgi:hypothetical protein